MPSRNESGGAKARVTLYTKPGCHLCEEAKREIGRAGCGGRYTLEEIDVGSDPTLLRRYGWDIPVVVIDGTVAFKHRLAAADFRRALEKYARKV